MIDIRVGEYARTTQGYIAKVERIDDTFIWFDSVIWFDYEECWELRIKSEHGLDSQLNKIVKHSFNIIDLIEVGDYVNGHLVFGFCKVGDTRCYLHVDDYEFSGLGRSIYPEDINTIVTKEVFKSMEYKVGGEDD